jgi:hypothetical protein
MKTVAAHLLSSHVAACCSDARPGGGDLRSLASDLFWLAAVTGLAAALTWVAAHAAEGEKPVPK